MRIRFVILITVIFTVMILTVSCMTINNKTASEKGSFEVTAKKNINSDNSNGMSFQSLNSASALTDLNAQAQNYGSTPGRVALAVIINKIDSSTIIEDLSKKSAQELFDILRQTASQKSQTLEALDQIYYLEDILASEKIYVNIQANNVISSKSVSYDDDWIQKFEDAVNNQNSAQ